MPPSPGWVEIIFATNSDANHAVFYFDNARLVPEPASICLLALVGAGLLVPRSR